MDKTLHNLKRDAESIFTAGIRAVDPQAAVLANLALDGDTLKAGDHTVPLPAQGRILVVGAGKAGAPMAAAVEDVLGGRLTGGLVCVKYHHLFPTAVVRIAQAAHPIPDEAGMNAAQEMASLLEPAGADDLVICLISGGGSALLPLPAPPVTLADKQAVTDMLLRSGAEIGELNCVRKHLSLVKGGGLARLAHPARVVALILSDVVGDPLDVIASGPTVGDPTTFADALKIVRRHRQAGAVPDTVMERLTLGAAGTLPETPKPGDPELEKVVNVLVGTNRIALTAAAKRARDLGYETSIRSSEITGEARQVAAGHAAMARDISRRRRPEDAPVCILSGGETTVTIRGDGKGGRNQEFALAAALGLEELPGAVILSGGTDGTDGPTDAAGAIADGTTVHRARRAGLDPARVLDNNDSYRLFEAIEDLLVTGPTLTNVMDLHVILVA